MANSNQSVTMNKNDSQCRVNDTRRELHESITAVFGGNEVITISTSEANDPSFRNWVPAGGKTATRESFIVNETSEEYSMP